MSSPSTIMERVSSQSSADSQALRVAIAFALVYVFWGSTYIAIRVAVESIPAALMTGVRFLIAGPAMLVWCWWRGHSIRLNRSDAMRLFTIGVLLLTGGNVALVWAEKYIASGLAALIVAIVPIWIALIETLSGGDRLRSRGWLGLLLGFFGLGVLIWPQLRASDAVGKSQLLACAMLMLGALSWAIGSVISRRSTLRVGPFAATGWEMTFAGLVNLTIGLALGDQHQAHWNRRGLIALAYLITFGSWIGFTAYIWLLEHVPTTKVATYAYVNPVVAVLLGWAILGERVDAFLWAGMVVIIGAVVLVTTSKLSSGRPQAVQDVCPNESGAD
jgi:drug/metabolite transporter (DMT)-like permease